MIQQKINKWIIMCCLILGSTISINAQVTPSQQTDTVKIIEWISSEIFRGETINDTLKRDVMVGNVVLRQGTTLFKCDSAIINKNTRVLEAFGKVHINESDSINIYSQYLKYYSTTRQAELRKNVKLTDGQIELQTQTFDYNLGENVGTYIKGGKVLNKESVLTSVDGIYYGDLKDVLFIKDVKLVAPQYQLFTDSLLYNTETELATFIAETTIIDSTQKQIVTNDGYYDLQNKKAKFGKRPIITDPIKHTYTIADEITTVDSTGMSILRGNAVHIDTAQGQVIGGNYLELNSITNHLYAEDEPYIIVKQENDSMYVRADKFISGKVTDLITELRIKAYSDTTLGLDSNAVNALYPLHEFEEGKDSANRYFIGYYNVKVYSDSLQTIADSIYYSNIDSVLRLYKDPVVWNTENQITGDTIYVFTKNQNPEEVYVFENAFAINIYHEDLYNQLKGRRINAYLKDGEIDLIRGRGNAESIYYIPDDDSALIGVNKLAADIIELRFITKELDKVVAIGQPSGKMSPIQQATDSDTKLPNFNWRDADRPKSKYDILPLVRFRMEATEEKEQIVVEKASETP